MKNLKKLTLLHSNDLHGDFLAEKIDEKLVGGVSRLSGYINKVRNEEKNVIYSISGDMFRGSLIDSKFQGLSTIEIMNLLAPDVVTIGNHEADYGLAHMLFLEKCASFPIINANMYIKYVGSRLFNSHFIKEIDRTWRSPCGMHARSDRRGSGCYRLRKYTEAITGYCSHGRGLH
jgi:5'-nucleotidase